MECCKKREIAMKITFNKDDVLKTIMTFGKYKGYNFKNILQLNPSYIMWLCEKKIIENLPEELYERARDCDWRKRQEWRKQYCKKRKKCSSGYIDDNFMWATNDISFYC